MSRGGNLAMRCWLFNDPKGIGVFMNVVATQKETIRSLLSLSCNENLVLYYDDEGRISLVTINDNDLTMAQHDKLLQSGLPLAWNCPPCDGREKWGSDTAPSSSKDDERPALTPAGAFAADLTTVLHDVERMLLQKNEAYGDSALDPLCIFSKGDPLEQIRVRIDDKLSRIARGQAAGEDAEQDLLGYLVLLRIARLRVKARRP